MYAYVNKMNNWGLNNTYDYYEFAIVLCMEILTVSFSLPTLR